MGENEKNNEATVNNETPDAPKEETPKKEDNKAVQEEKKGLPKWVKPVGYTLGATAGVLGLAVLGGYIGGHLAGSDLCKWAAKMCEEEKATKKAAQEAAEVVVDAVVNSVD